MDRNFYRKDATELAPALVGKLRCRKMPDGSIKKLRIDGTFNGKDILSCPDLWIEVNITCDKRVGIAYADEKDREKLWRFKHG